MGRTTGAAPTPWRRWAPLLALAAAFQAVLVTTGAAPPIYDGIGFPDEPYRFVDPPAGYRATKPPTSAHAVVALSHGRSTRGVTANSAETGPQVSVYIPGGGLQADPDTTSATVDAVPVAVTGDPPPHHQWSNVYRVTLSVPGGDARVAGDHGDIQLRAPTFQADPTFYVRDGSGWTALRTTQTGRDIYQARFTTAGDYVLTGREPLDFNAKDKSSEAAVGIVGFVVSGVAVVIVLVLFVRGERRRSKKRAAS